MAQTVAILIPDGVSPAWNPLTKTLDCSIGGVPVPPNPDPPPQPIPPGSLYYTIFYPMTGQDHVDTNGFVNQTLIIALPIPLNAKLGTCRFAAVEFNGPRTGRTLCVSDVPGQMTNSMLGGSNFSVAPNFAPIIGAAAPPGVPLFVPGRTYYVNMQNQHNGVSTLLPGQIGNMRCDWTVPL